MPERTPFPPEDSDLYPIAEGLNSDDINIVGIIAAQEIITTIRAAEEKKELSETVEPLTRMLAQFFWYLQSNAPRDLTEVAVRREVFLNLSTLLSVQNNVDAVPTPLRSTVPNDFWPDLAHASRLEEKYIIFENWRNTIRKVVSFLHQADKDTFPHDELVDLLRRRFSDLGRLDE